MKVLMITGDRNFEPGHERYELQRSVVDELHLVYWGRGSVWPRIPTGHFDVVTVQDPFWRGLFGWWIAKRIGAKLNVQVHTDLSAYSGLKLVLSQLVLRRADTIRVVSNKIKLQVEHMGVHANIIVLPVYVEISKFQTIVRRAHDGKNILWIGRFEEEKNPLQAIEVLKDVLQVEPAAKLVMLGKGSLEKRVAERAANLPIELPGWQDPASFLAIADVVLCTSVHESWGASIVEALAAGVPVIAPDVGVASEAGAIVVPRNKLAERLVTVLEEGAKGELLLTMPTKEEWADQWKESL